MFRSQSCVYVFAPNGTVAVCNGELPTCKCAGMGHISRKVSRPYERTTSTNIIINFVIKNMLTLFPYG